MKFNQVIIIGFAGILAFTACEKTDTEKELSSFDLIQEKIFTPTCATAGCHASENDETFGQHRLVLTKGLAYKYLFNAEVRNAAAKNDGLLRVKASDSNKSLLYHKLVYETSHHGGKTYGNVMPLGGDLLSVGKIEFIRRWIEAGAPETGNVADANLLDDTTPSTNNYTPLAIPAVGTGFQMRLEQFEVAPNFEREFFIRKPVGNTETVYVNRVQIKMRPGSHHFILYDFRDNKNLPTLNAIRDLRNTNGGYNLNTFLEMANHVFMFGGAESASDYTFPEGTAVEVPAGATFDMNSHSFNKSTTKSSLGEVSVNLYTIPKDKVKTKVKILDLGINTRELNLPPKQRTIITKDFIFGSDAKIVTLFSHTHKYGEKFEILIKGGVRNGEVVYTSTDWEHPEKTNYLPYISLKKGEGLTSRITYNNTSSKTVTFGLTSEDEMGIIFGYYFEE